MGETNFAATLAAAQTAKRAIDKTREDFESKTKILHSLLQAPCAKAVAAYNDKAGQSLRIRDFKISFDIWSQRVKLSLNLYWPVERVITEDSDPKDCETVQNKLAPFANTEFDAAGITFTLGEIEVLGYYFPQ